MSKLQLLAISSLAVYVNLIQFVLCGHQEWTMQLCISGKTYSLTDSTCDSAVGIWFTRPRKVYKACFDSGVWAVYKDWCEPHPIIWTVGTGVDYTGCMDDTILESVLGIVYLGNGTKGVTVTTPNQRLVLGPLEKSSYIFDMLDSELNLIAWGNQKPYSIHEEARYRSLPERNKCFLGGTPFLKQYKFRANQITGVSFSLHQENCPLSTSYWDKILPLPNRKMDVKLVVKAEEWSPDKPFLCPDNEEIREIEANCDEMYGRDSPIGVDDTVDDQSSRVALKFQAHVFNGLEPPEMKFNEWKVFQLVRMVFETVCPSQIVPAFFIKHIMMLYRLLLLESLIRHPVHEEMDAQTYSRIETALHNCISTAREFMFVNSTDNGCLADSMSIQLQYTNGSIFSAPVQLPDEIRNDLEKYDLIMEATWKLMLFSHYHCADHFQEFASDLSIFHSKWQELVAPDLQERWINPGKSFEMMKQIFMSINLKQAVRNLDSCVAAAQMQSVYQGWIKRPVPKTLVKKKRILNSELMWDGHAYCMNSYIYPALALGFPLDKCGLKFSNN